MRWFSLAALVWFGSALSPWSALAARTAPLRLSFANDVAADVIARVRSAVGGQLHGLAGLAAPEDDDARIVGAIVITMTGDGASLSFRDRNGNLVGTRSLKASSTELLASEVASMARAFVVSAQPRERSDSAEDGTRPAKPDAPARAGTEPREHGDSARAGSEPREHASDRGTMQEHSAAVRDGEARDAARLWLTVLYTGEHYAPQLPWKNGLRAESALRWGTWTYTAFGYAYHPQSEVAHPLATVELRDHAVYALAGFGREGARWGLAGEFALGATKSVRETTDTADEIRAEAPAARWGTSLALRSRARLRIPGLPRVWIELIPALVLVPAVRPLAVGTDEETTIISPRLARVRIDVGLSFDVL